MTRRNIALLIITIGLVVLGASGCNAQQDQTDATGLEGPWGLVSTGPAANQKPILQNTEITAVFVEEAVPFAGAVTGTAGCNRYWAQYETQGSDITIDEMNWTEMACVQPAGVMAQEGQFLAMMGNASQYEIDGETLRIFYTGGGVLTFTRLEK